MPRWCQITQNKFRYYKNRVAAYQNPGKPLLSVPIIDIVNIIKTRPSKNEVQIEIITQKDLSSYISERSLIEKAYVSPQRNKLNITPDREVKPGHLMRIPHSRNTSRLHDASQSVIQFDKFIGDNNHSRNILRNNATCSTFKTFQQRAVHSRNTKGSYEVFSALAQFGVSSNSTWSKRESEWYEIEEKLIFKNNTANVTDGDLSVILEWTDCIAKQQAALNSDRVY